MLINRVAKKIGICEVGYTDECKQRTGESVELWVNAGIAMCEYCAAAEEKLTAKNAALAQVITDSHKQDATLELVQDVYNAKTTAAIELWKAIAENTDIPTSEKEYAFNKAMVIRYETMREVVLAKELSLREDRNELAMWRTQIQHTTPKLRAELQGEFNKFHSSYKPEVPKKIKPTKVPTTNKSTNIVVKKKDVNEASVKYGIAIHLIRMYMTIHKEMTPEQVCQRITANNARRDAASSKSE